VEKNMKSTIKNVSVLTLVLALGGVGCMVVAPSQTVTAPSNSAAMAVASLDHLPSGWKKFDASMHKAQSGIQVASSVSPDSAANGADRTVQLALSGVTGSDAKVKLSLTKGLTLVAGAMEWTLSASNPVNHISITVKGNGSDQGNLQYINVFAGQNNVTNALAIKVNIEDNSFNSKPANSRVETDSQGRKLIIMTSDK
jgi:hypothetical protein